MKISFVIPSRNNLEYFKWAYDSIRKHQGNHDVFICAASDASTDGTVEHFQELEKTDAKFRCIIHDGPERLGHTILYDRIIRELVETEVALIYHSDMYLCPGALDEIETYMYSSLHEPNTNTIVSLTRIEPPLHPAGPEKLIRDFGLHPNSFDEKGLLDDIKVHHLYLKDRFTRGVFAPWAVFKSYFLEIGGHDPLFAPQSKEDSDIFNRFLLHGANFIQTWRGFVYHLTCRGNRRNTNDGAPDVHTNNPEWERQNIRSARNFIRKWGSYVKHTELMLPIVPPKYDIGIHVDGNITLQLLQTLEPWCNNLYCNASQHLINQYVELENESRIDIASKFKPTTDINNDIVIKINPNLFTSEDVQYLYNISEIISSSGDQGSGMFELGNMLIEIHSTTEYQKQLIVIK